MAYRPSRCWRALPSRASNGTKIAFGATLLNSFATIIDNTAFWAPWCYVLLFLAASFLMIWRLEAMNASGVEGTVLGTLVMPYCTGMGNLIFAFVVARKGGPGSAVFTNCAVNNVTNMTLLIGLPTMIWGMNVLPAPKAKGSKKNQRKKEQEHKVNRLSLLLTLAAVLFFTGAVWALAGHGKLGFSDGLVLVLLFLFWQCFHVFEVLKSNVRQNKSFGWMLPVDLALLAIGAYGIYLSTDWLVDWVSKIQTGGLISAKYLGLLSGWLNVVPNGLLAFYYAWKRNPEVVYTSQVGDGHICIPLCIGIYALWEPIMVRPLFFTELILLMGAAILHFVLILVFGRLPRIAGLILTLAYGAFLCMGLEN